MKRSRAKIRIDFMRAVKIQQFLRFGIERESYWFDGSKFFLDIRVKRRVIRNASHALSQKHATIKVGRHTHNLWDVDAHLLEQDNNSQVWRINFKSSGGRVWRQSFESLVAADN